MSKASDYFINSLPDDLSESERRFWLCIAHELDASLDAFDLHPWGVYDGDELMYVCDTPSCAMGMAMLYAESTYPDEDAIECGRVGTRPIEPDGSSRTDE